MWQQRQQPAKEMNVCRGCVTVSMTVYGILGALIDFVSLPKAKLVAGSQ